MSNLTPNPLVMGGVFFINAMGMTFIAASIGFMVMIAIMGRRVTFARFFSIYALSAGVTLLASWLPFFIWLTEPLCICGIDVFLFLVGFTHDGILEMMRPTVCPVHEQKKVR